MARTLLVPVELTRDGVRATAVAGTADGHKFPNTGREFLKLNNSNASVRVVTVVTQSTRDDQAVADREVTVTGSNYLITDVWPTDDYMVPSGTDLGMTYLNFPAGVESQVTVEVYYR